MVTECRQAGAEPEVTPEAYREFEDLFHRWMDEGWNQHRLEAGGTGDLSTLATYCAAWRDRNSRALEHSNHL